MKIDNLMRGLKILRDYERNFSIEVVPKSFENGTPDHSSFAYILVEAYVLEHEEKELKSLGWVGEQEGLSWCWRNF